MQTAAEMIPSHVHPTVLREATQRVLLSGVSWATYEALLADMQDSHAAHFAYDQGVLEIMVLSGKHELPGEFLLLKGERRTSRDFWGVSQPSVLSSWT